MVTTNKPFVLSDFRGGMRMDDDATKLADDEYFFLSNGRSRNGRLRPVKLPLRVDTGLASVPKQCLIGAGSILFTMYNGMPWYRDFAVQDQFSQLIQFDQMDVSLPIYGEVIPASTINFTRLSSNKQEPVIFGDPVTKSPRALILQNGFNQPRLILGSGLTRLTKNLGQWNIDNPEYVPIAKQMYYHKANGVLYSVSKDGLEIYRSVAGQPLNYVVAVDTDGNRLVDTFYNEEASRLAHQVSYNPITCIKGLNYKSDVPEEDPPFFIGTHQGSFAVFPTYNRTFFGESTFRNIDLFPIGPANQFSFEEMFGDYGFVTTTDIHSFNAIAQFRNEGKNSPFSLQIDLLFDGITEQTAVCAASFDNYTLFSVTTRFGNGVLVFDPLIKKFVSFDIYPDVDQITNFAEIVVGNKRRLFALTITGAIYEMFAGETAEMLCYPREWRTGNMNIEQAIHKIGVAVANIKEAGILTITDYNDTKRGTPIDEPLAINIPNNALPTTPPYGTETKDTIREITKMTSFAKRGWKVGVEVKLDCDAEILEIQVQPKVEGSNNPEQEKASVYAGQSR